MDNVSTGSLAYFDRIPDELVILIFSFLAYSMRWLRLPPEKNDGRRPLPHPLLCPMGIASIPNDCLRTRLLAGMGTTQHLSRAFNLGFASSRSSSSHQEFTP
jgi:hypothetical protein